MNSLGTDLQNSFRIRNEVIIEAVEEMKKRPPAALVEYKNAHPVHKATKGISCALIADYFGLAESTLRKLKSGAINNPVCFTLWLLWIKGGIHPMDVLGLQRGRECTEKECLSDSRVNEERIAAKRERIADLESQLATERTETARLRKLLLRETRALAAVSAVCIVLIAIGVWLVYKLANPSEGIFQTQ